MNTITDFVSNQNKAIAIIKQTMIYTKHDMDESLVVDYVDEEEGNFTATGQDSGEEYYIDFAEIDLEKDVFYKLQVIDVNAE